MKFAITSLARPLLLGSTILAGLALATDSRPASAIGNLRACTNNAWADYNECLMESDSGWHRWGCDLHFQADYLLCWSLWAQEAAILE